MEVSNRYLAKIDIINMQQSISGGKIKKALFPALKTLSNNDRDGRPASQVLV
jgi:hypothetical protein